MFNDLITEKMDSAREFLVSPAGRKVRNVLGGALIVGSPLLFRVPVLRRHRALRLVELLGGVALLVGVGERLRDWEPGRASDRG
jgi:hypothetical protein